MNEAFALLPIVAFGTAFIMIDIVRNSGPTTHGSDTIDLNPFFKQEKVKHPRPSVQIPTNGFHASCMNCTTPHSTDFLFCDKCLVDAGYGTKHKVTFR